MHHFYIRVLTSFYIHLYNIGSTGILNLIADKSSLCLCLYFDFLGQIRQTLTYVVCVRYQVHQSSVSHHGDANSLLHTVPCNSTDHVS